MVRQECRFTPIGGVQSENKTLDKVKAINPGSVITAEMMDDLLDKIRALLLKRMNPTSRIVKLDSAHGRYLGSGILDFQKLATISKKCKYFLHYLDFLRKKYRNTFSRNFSFSPILHYRVHDICES